MYALQGVLPKEHLECWWLYIFVQACILICQPVISPTVIDRIDTFLIEFCQAVESYMDHKPAPLTCTYIVIWLTVYVTMVLHMPHGASVLSGTTEY